MDFKIYIEQDRRNAHKDILTEICMNINNCADCYNEETKKTECRPFSCLEVLKVTGTSFYMDAYDAKTNKKLIEIASRFGYKINFVVDNEKSVVTEIRFCK